MSKNVFFFKVLILLSFIAQFNLLISPLSLVLAKPRATLPPFDIEPTPTPIAIFTPTPSPFSTSTPIPSPEPTPTKPPGGGSGPVPYPDVSFVYDGNGVRVAKITNSGVTLYVGGLEKNLATGETVKYYNLGGKNVAYKSSLDNKVNYVISDHLSSTRTVISSEGIILSKANYYPYGKVRIQEGTLPSRQYTNQINDQETTLYFYNARYYNPKTGVFITADEAQGPNRYAYVGGNPILRNDPSGMMEAEDSGGGGFYNNIPSYTVTPEMFNLDPAAEWENSLLHAAGDWLGENTRFGTAYWEKRYPGFSQWSEEGQQGAVNKDLTGQFTDPSNLSGMSGGVKIVGGASKNIVIAFIQKLLNGKSATLIDEAAGKFVANSRSTRIVTRGLADLTRGENPQQSLSTFYDYLKEKGVRLVRDASGYTNQRNMIRTVGNKMLVNEEVWDGLTAGESWAQQEMLSHGLHDYYAIIAEQMVGGRNRAGFGSFIHLADYYFAKQTWTISNSDAWSRFYRAAGTVSREFKVNIGP